VGGIAAGDKGDREKFRRVLEAKGDRLLSKRQGRKRKRKLKPENNMSSDNQRKLGCGTMSTTRGGGLEGAVVGGPKKKG